MSRSLTIALVSLLAGCTFNVSSFSVDDITSVAPIVPTRIRADLSSVSFLDGFGLRVDGAPTTTTASARVTASGLLGAGVDATAVRNGIHVSWPVSATDPTTLGLGVTYDGPMVETVTVEGLNVALPSVTALDLSLGSHDVDVVGVTGMMTLTTDSGSISVQGAGDFALTADSGSIDVAGHGGSASCTSGSVHFEATGAMVSHTSSGSIAGSFGGGGELAATSGSIDVVLTTALDRDLTLSAGSGSIHLVVPSGSSMRIETHTGSGSSHVSVGGVSSNDDFTGTIGSGGFLVRATTGSGSIHISEP